MKNFIHEIFTGFCKPRFNWFDFILIAIASCVYSSTESLFVGFLTLAFSSVCYGLFDYLSDKYFVVYRKEERL